MSKKTLVIDEKFIRKADAMWNEYANSMTPTRKYKQMVGKFKTFEKLAKNCDMTYGISNTPPNVEITMQGSYLEANRAINPELKSIMDDIVRSADAISFEALEDCELLMTAVFGEMFE